MYTLYIFLLKNQTYLVYLLSKISSKKIENIKDFTKKTCFKWFFYYI